METKDTYLTGIDITKLIASALVLMSHTRIITSYSPTIDSYFINSIFRWAVPFFFMASGYFMPQNIKSIIKYSFRIFRLYFIWSIFYAMSFS